MQKKLLDSLLSTKICYCDWKCGGKTLWCLCSPALGELFYNYFQLLKPLLQQSASSFKKLEPLGFCFRTALLRMLLWSPDLSIIKDLVVTETSVPLSILKFIFKKECYFEFSLIASVRSSCHANQKSLKWPLLDKDVTVKERAMLMEEEISSHDQKMFQNVAEASDGCKNWSQKKTITIKFQGRLWNCIIILTGTAWQNITIFP